jgi:hypothetical protein
MTNFMFISGMVAKLSPTDYVGLLSRRLYGYDGRICIFFFILSQFDRKWRTSVLVSGLITFTAHYFYMRDYWANLVNRLPVMLTGY